jgi:hypothetical protein
MGIVSVTRYCAPAAGPYYRKQAEHTQRSLGHSVPTLPMCQHVYITDSPTLLRRWNRLQPDRSLAHRLTRIANSYKFQHYCELLMPKYSNARNPSPRVGKDE